MFWPVWLANQEQRQALRPALSTWLANRACRRWLGECHRAVGMPWRAVRVTRHMRVGGWGFLGRGVSPGCQPSPPAPLPSRGQAFSPGSLPPYSLYTPRGPQSVIFVHMHARQCRCAVGRCPCGLPRPGRSQVPAQAGNHVAAGQQRPLARLATARPAMCAALRGNTLPCRAWVPQGQ